MNYIDNYREFVEVDYVVWSPELGMYRTEETYCKELKDARLFDLASEAEEYGVWDEVIIPVFIDSVVKRFIVKRSKKNDS